MPIYEFNCPRCNEDFEELVRNPKEKIVCPECGCKKVQKRPSVFGFKSGKTFVSSSKGGSGCSGCSSSNCSGCH